MKIEYLRCRYHGIQAPNEDLKNRKRKHVKNLGHILHHFRFLIGFFLFFWRIYEQFADISFATQKECSFSLNFAKNLFRLCCDGIHCRCSRVASSLADHTFQITCAQPTKLENSFKTLLRHDYLSQSTQLITHFDPNWTGSQPNYYPKPSKMKENPSLTNASLSLKQFSMKATVRCARTVWNRNSLFTHFISLFSSIEQIAIKFTN